MVVEKECRCSDSSEPSNVTSLRTDISSIINCSDLNKTELPSQDQRLSGNECFCRPDEYPVLGSPSSRPVRQVSPQRYQTDSESPPTNRRNQLITGQPILREEQNPIICLCPNPYIASNDHNQGGAKCRRSLIERFSFKWPRRGCSKAKDKTFQVKVKKNQGQCYPKRLSCCELSEGIPRQKKLEFDKSSYAHPTMEDNSERIDIYYFDHGNSAYYRTTDAPPILATEKCAERTDYMATRFWAEIFGTIHIGMAFVTAFILQLLRFFLFSIIRPLTVGVLQLAADYFLKPCLSIVFNAMIQPFLILFYNVATSLRDLCEPLAEALGFFLKEIGQLFKAIRVVEVNNSTTNSCT